MYTVGTCIRHRKSTENPIQPPYRHHNTENSELNINLNRKHFSAYKQYYTYIYDTYIVEKRVHSKCTHISLGPENNNLHST